MSEMTAMILLGIALVFLAGLGAYACSLWQEVRRREAFKRDEIRRANEKCLASLDAIARAMLQEQVDLTEGALRCKVLLEIIEPALMERPCFHVFGMMHARTAHLHTHSARKALSRRARMKEDRERLAIEDEYRSDLFDAAKAVRELTSGWPEGLH
ncbi:DUF2489 domain-containing protein [Litchfieldella rifensis]|uniref:DUF2489 domain-containing protein n=1 Tax=Litchfieldella rifensis TaxID=762643 RepID=A0ABV7LSA4_9GAMM